jgi:hypothetical protein
MSPIKLDAATSDKPTTAANSAERDAQVDAILQRIQRLQAPDRAR